MKKVKTLTENGIQEILKQIITPSKLRDFFLKTITADSLNKYSFLLDVGDLSKEDPLLTKKQQILRNKYIYDLIIAVLYIEAMPIEDIEVIIEGSTETEIKNIFEEIVVLEYDLYQIPASAFSGIASSTNFDKKILVRDQIIPIYHSTSSKLAYKDLANITSEIDIIYNETIASYTSNALISNIDKLSLFRINEKLSISEGADLEFYSFLFNYNPDNKNFIRKSVALELDESERTKGYYKKLNGDSLETIYFNDIISLYQNYSLELNNDAKDAHDFIIEYREQLLKRTINYYEK